MLHGKFSSTEKAGYFDKVGKQDLGAGLLNLDRRTETLKTKIGLSIVVVTGFSSLHDELPQNCTGLNQIRMTLQKRHWILLTEKSNQSWLLPAG